MELALGIIIGALLSAFLLFVDILIHRKVARGGIQEIITKISQGKGEILEASNDELDIFISNLPTE